MTVGGATRADDNVMTSATARMCAVDVQLRHLLRITLSTLIHHQ